VSRFVPVGQSTTTPSSKTQRAEIELEIYIGANGYVQNAGFTQNSIPALETGAITGPVAVVLHRTVSTSAASTLSAFRRGIGTHFLIDKDGTTYQCASLLKKTAHVGPIRSRCHIEGTCLPDELATFKDWESRMKCHDHEKVKSYPTRYPMNEDSVGIEVVAMYQEATAQWDAATPEQTRSIRVLVEILKDQYGLSDSDIYEHHKIARKTEGEGSDLYYVPNPPPIVSPRFPFP